MSKLEQITKKEIEETLIRILKRNFKRRGLRIKAVNKTLNTTKKISV